MLRVLFALLSNEDFYRPIGMMLLSAVAKQNGYETALVILSKEDVFAKIDQFKPGVIAYSSHTGEHKYYKQINDKIKLKYPGIITIMGGHHATFFPEDLNTTLLDAICIGEGEYAFIEFLDKVEKGEDFSKIKNIMVPGGTMPEIRPLVQDLDSLPFPDWELLYKNRNTGEKQPPVMNFIANRGCPYSCPYCFNEYFRRYYAGQKYSRRHSVDYMLTEIAAAKEKLDFKFIRFIDDIFVLRADGWLREFSARYPKEIGIPFYVHSRFDLINNEIAKLLQEAGCTAVHMSIESANPALRNGLLKRQMTDEQIIKGAEACNGHNLTMVVNTMLGVPGSSLDDDIKAVDFSIKAGLYVIELPIFIPYPGTGLGDMCINTGLFDMGRSDISMYGLSRSSVLKCFNEKEKKVQINISLLGPGVVRHPYLRSIVMRVLIYLPTNRLFYFIYKIGKSITYQKMVYKRKYTLTERLEIIKRTFRLEKLKRPEGEHRKSAVRKIYDEKTRLTNIVLDK